MNLPGILFKNTPELKDAILIAGFEGWGNAADISIKMAEFLIKKFRAQPFAELDADFFYRYDGPRPIVEIEDGYLLSYTPPGGRFYTAKAPNGERDIVLLKSDEPNINWGRFSESLFSLCLQLNVTTMVTLGSMFDRVLHTDRVVSGLASDPDLFAHKRLADINAISYKGPAAIHSILQYEGTQNGLECISLWAHCPFYIQSSHFGILAHLGDILSIIGNFEMDVSELEIKWEKQNRQFQSLIDKHPELQEAIKDLQSQETFEEPKKASPSADNSPNIINIQDFLNPK